jgi:tRNA nucleotidyltransferase/poly(A) polymerase
LQQLDQLGILAAIHPGLMVDEWLLERLQILCCGLDQTPWAGVSPETSHYLGLLAFSLAGDELETLMQRLNLRTHQRAVLHSVYTLRRRFEDIAKADRNSELYHLLAPTSAEARLIAWLALDDEAARRQIARFQTELKDVAPLIDGHYLKKELQLPSGPIYRRILNALRAARLDGLVATLADERALVEQILAGGEGEAKRR